MKDTNYSTRELLLKIPVMKHVFADLPKRNDAYLQILDYLFQNDFTQEDIPLKSAKEVQQDLGLSPGKLKQNLDRIYDDLIGLLSYDGEKYLDFGSNLCELYFTTWKQFQTIRCKLQSIPRVETVKLDIIHPIFGISSFFVLKVEHELTCRGMESSIWLKNGFYNAYAAYEYDKRQFDWVSKDREETEIKRYNQYEWLDHRKKP